MTTHVDPTVTRFDQGNSWCATTPGGELVAQPVHAAVAPRIYLRLPRKRTRSAASICDTDGVHTNKCSKDSCKSVCEEGSTERCGARAAEEAVEEETAHERMTASLSSLCFPSSPAFSSTSSSSSLVLLPLHDRATARLHRRKMSPHSYVQSPASRCHPRRRVELHLVDMEQNSLLAYSLQRGTITTGNTDSIINSRDNRNNRTNSHTLHFRQLCCAPSRTEERESDCTTGAEHTNEVSDEMVQPALQLRALHRLRHCVVIDCTGAVVTDVADAERSDWFLLDDQASRNTNDDGERTIGASSTMAAGMAAVVCESVRNTLTQKDSDQNEQVILMSPSRPPVSGAQESTNSLSRLPQDVNVATGTLDSELGALNLDKIVKTKPILPQPHSEKDARRVGGKRTHAKVNRTELADAADCSTSSSMLSCAPQKTAKTEVYTLCTDWWDSAVRQKTDGCVIEQRLCGHEQDCGPEVSESVRAMHENTNTAASLCGNDNENTTADDDYDQDKVRECEVLYDVLCRYDPALRTWGENVGDVIYESRRAVQGDLYVYADHRKDDEYDSNAEDHSGNEYPDDENDTLHDDEERGYDGYALYGGDEKDAYVQHTQYRRGCNRYGDCFYEDSYSERSLSSGWSSRS